MMRRRCRCHRSAEVTTELRELRCQVEQLAGRTVEVHVSRKTVAQLATAANQSRRRK